MSGTVVPFPGRPQAMSIREVETALLGIAGHIAAAQCWFLVLLAEFDERTGWVGDGIHSCAHWLSWKVGMAIRTAHEHPRVARALRRLPLITEAFAGGQLSYSKVRAITRVIGDDTAALVQIAQQLADGTSNLKHTTVADPETAEKILLNIARHGTASQLETLVRAVRQLRTRPEDLTARRSLTWRWDTGGMLVVTARLAPDQRATFLAEIEAQTPKPKPRRPSTEPIPADLTERAREQEPGLVADGRPGRLRLGMGSGASSRAVRTPGI